MRLLRFADNLIDLEEVVALVGRTVYLRDGRKMGVGAATADALRAAIPAHPPLSARPRDTRLAKENTAE